MGGGPLSPAPHHLPHLLITLPMTPPTSLLAALRHAHPDLHITYINTRTTPRVPAPLYASCTILATLTLLPADPVVECPHLRLVHIFAADVHFLRNTKLWEADGRDGRVLINLTNSSGSFSPQIAEWASMTRLAHTHSHRLPSERQKRNQPQPQPRFQSTEDLVGQRVGILGYGSVGRHVARLARSAGMEVIAYTARARRYEQERVDDSWCVPGMGDVDGELPDEWWSSEDGEGKGGLHGFLGSGLDWLVVAVPYTKQTAHLLSRDEFEILARRPPFITNIARGPVVDQRSLVEALQKGYVRGAALDAKDDAPLDPSSAFYNIPNVTVTPHVNGSSKNATVRSFQILSENARRWAKGGELVNVVDRGRGY